MEYEAIDALREKHAAWRLLRAGNASLIFSFLGSFFVEGNRGACAASELAAALDDHLYSLNAAIHTDSGEPRYPKPPRTYLEDWAATDAGYLRRFYPAGDDEVHYEITPAFEKAYAWVESLKTRPFVATESRLHTVVELLRQIVHGTEVDPSAVWPNYVADATSSTRRSQPSRAGELPLLAPASVRDRFQQFTTTARELLSDFREVEENFRRLDRAARERIAAWDGAKGELLGRARRQSLGDHQLRPRAQLPGLLRLPPLRVTTAGTDRPARPRHRPRRRRRRSAGERRPPRMVGGSRTSTKNRPTDLRTAAAIPG